MKNVLVIGASGYVGAELVKYLNRHLHVNIVSLFVSEESNDSGKKFSDIHRQYKGIIDLILKPLKNPLDILDGIDVIFLATDHIISHDLAPLFLKRGIIVFDLSGSFRIKDPDVYRKYYKFKHKHKYWLNKSIYGLVEWEELSIKTGQLIAIPGCYATAVQLGLKPIIKSELIDVSQTPVINAISGVSGSGRKPTIVNSFCEVSLQPYNIFTHRHQPEIISHLGIPIIFIPNLGSFTRGILAIITCRLKFKVEFMDVFSSFFSVYKNKPLIRIYNKEMPSIKSVSGLPFCDIGFVVNNKDIVIVVAIDNLLKGAAAQAVQCFNIRFNFLETLSLI